ncbi:glutactin-like [Wyeomyia smithii]|uniref:glutactin-like n=1 Tax=Wyeomyia smithii TaxID=174621 RepID=UPI002467E446|nr:glutactin-like [Wyeomyia smithii]
MTTICGTIFKSEVLRKSIAPNRIAVRLFSSVENHDHPIVELPGLGTLKGSSTRGAWTGSKIYQFLNIRYAEPADGKKRFKPPIPVKPWEGVLDVSMPKLGSPVLMDMKKYTPDQLAQNHEDCINVCVYTKNLNAKKPVIVYIHGGMFFTGAASHFPPNYIMEKDVVLVVPQYRLGPLGFISTRTENIPGNAAIHDVKLALEWVQKHITQFGGDPNQVTVMAQSSGASMVSSMLYSPAIDTEKLFHKLILQSAVCFTNWSYDHNPVENARRIALAAGCEPKASNEEIEQFLMEIDVPRLLSGFTKHYRYQMNNEGVNQIGGCRLVTGCPHQLYPELPYHAMRKGKVRKNLPMLIGTMQQEGSFALLDIFIALGSKNLLQQKSLPSHMLLDEINRIMGMDDPSCVTRTLQSLLFYNQKLLRQNNLMKMIPAMADSAAACLVKGSVLKQAQLNSVYQPNSTFLYSFDYAGQHTRFGYGFDVSQFPFTGGVHHTNDLLYLFPYPAEASQLNEADSQMAKRTVDLWTSFAIEGVPSAEGLPVWPSMRDAYGPYLKINQNCTVAENYAQEFTVTMQDPASIAKSVEQRSELDVQTPPVRDKQQYRKAVVQ